MKIIKLKAENIKKLVAVEITPNGSVIKITGKNGSGKTSVLDAIFWALAGAEGIQEKPVRSGQEKAVVELDLGDMIVTRRFNAKEDGSTTSLVIENKEGLRYKSPQALLDSLLGKLTFDPLDFMRQDPRKQFETLRLLVGLDFSDMDEKRRKAYDERAQVNRDVKRSEMALENLNVSDDCPTKFVSLQEIMDKIEEANRIQKAKSDWEKELGDFFHRHETITKRQEQIKREIETIRNTLRTLEDEQETLASETELLSANRQGLESQIKELQVPDVSEFKAQLAGAEEVNKKVRLWEQAEKVKAEIFGAKNKAVEFSSRIAEIDDAKREQVAKATLPLPGLGFGDGNLTFNDLPLEQSSAAEQLRVSVAIAMALNPKLRVLRITDGSLLDSTSMKVIEEMCTDQDFQLWIEITSDGEERPGIVIEDGIIKYGQNTNTEQAP